MKIWNDYVRGNQRVGVEGREPPSVSHQVAGFREALQNCITRVDYRTTVEIQLVII